MRLLILTCILSFVVASSLAQKVPYQITYTDNSARSINKVSGETDSLTFVNLLRIERKKLLKEGHLLASYRINWSDSVYKAELYKGDVFTWGSIDTRQVPDGLLTKSGFRQYQFKNKVVKASTIGDLLTRIIHQSEMNGLPFASVKLDSVHIVDSTISGKLVYQAGPEIKYGQLEASDSALVKDKYLESYLELNEGQLFNSSQIDKIPRMIRQLSFCSLDKPPEIKFEHKTCKIKLYLKPNKANSIDALLGLAPNQTNDNKLLATGYVNLDLHNLFRSGKQLYFSWRSYGASSQKLMVFYNHTNLFGSVINVKGAFDLLKQDTTFLNRNFYLTIGYKKAAYELNLTSQYLTSRLLSYTQTNAAGLVPEIDFDAQYYGVEFTKNELDNKLNPTRGWSIRSGVNIGAKKVLDTDFVEADVYDSLERKMIQGGISITGELAIPVSKIVVGYTKWEASTIQTSGILFNNDLYRLGGVNSLRGFNELEIYASSYWLTQWEARLILGPESRLFGFFDWAYMQNQETKPFNNYIGVGAGILLNTQAGNIQLVLAFGKSGQQSLSLTESKIHIGYVAKF